MTSARLVLLALAVVAIVQFAALGPRLPDPMASHFGLDGRADGWMPRAGFLAFYAGTLVGMMALLLGVAAGIRRLPDTFLNIPNADYWLAPSRREQTLEFAGRQIEWIAVVVFATFLAIFQLTVIANQQPAPALPTLAIWGLLAGTVLLTLGICWTLRRRFGRPAQDH